MASGDYMGYRLHYRAMQRSFLLFTNGLKSQETVKQYKYYLDKFINFYHIKDYDSLATVSPAELQIMVEDYVMFLKKEVSPNTVPTPMYAIQAFLECNDIELRWKKIRRLYPAKVKLSGERGWTTKEIQKMLQSTTNLRNRAIIHFFASTAARIGAVPDLKLRHLKEIPSGCKSVLVYEDSREEYTTFLTPEASKILDEYFTKRRSDGEDLGINSPVFRTAYKFGIQPTRSITKKAIENIISRAATNAGLRKNKKNGRYEVQLDHGFRKRFNTILKLNKKINPNIVEKLMGHKRGLDGVYLKPTVDEMFEEFKIGITDLTIDDSERLASRNRELELEKSEYEKKVPAIIEEAVKRVKEQLRKEGSIIDLK